MHFTLFTINKNLFKERQRGQALIPVLIIILIVLVLGAGSLYLSLGSMLLSSYSYLGEAALISTEGAMEDALMGILRNPDYAGGSLQVADVPCTISVSGSSPAVITAECDTGRSIRRLESEVTFVNGEMTVDNLQEIE